MLLRHSLLLYAFLEHAKLHTDSLLRELRLLSNSGGCTNGVIPPSPSTTVYGLPVGIFSTSSVPYDFKKPDSIFRRL